MKLFWGEGHKTSLIISQHWFRHWLGAVRQQAITWANVGVDPCRHLTSLGHNELICVDMDVVYKCQIHINLNTSYLHNWCLPMGKRGWTGIYVNMLRLRLNVCHFAGNVLKCFSCERFFFYILNQISLKFVPKGQIVNNLAVVQIMVLSNWRWRAIIWPSFDNDIWWFMTLLVNSLALGEFEW